MENRERHNIFAYFLDSATAKIRIRVTATPKTIKIEKNIRNVSEKNIQALCDKLCVNEKYLRYGIEPMFLEDADFSFDEYIKEKGLSVFGRKMVKCIIEMPTEIQKPLWKYLQECLDKEE